MTPRTGCGRWSELRVLHPLRGVLPPYGVGNARSGSVASGTVPPTAAALTEADLRGHPTTAGHGRRRGVTPFGAGRSGSARSAAGCTRRVRTGRPVADSTPPAVRLRLPPGAPTPPLVPRRAAPRR